MAGMFANADWASALQAALAGYMSRNNPQTAASIFRSLDAKRQAAAEAAQYNQKRQDDNSDWMAREQWKLDHPSPGQPGEFETRLMQSGVQPGSPEWVNAMKAAVQNTTDPVVMTPQGPMLRSQLLGSVPTAPVGKLTPIPDGGPMGMPPSGGFPGPF